MPPKATKVEDLRKQCKSAGLDTTGNKADLVKRLKNQKKQKNREELSPADQDDPKYDAILVTKSKTSSEEEIKSEAKDVPGLQEGEHEVQKVRGEPFVGNRRGRGLTGIGERIRALEEKTSALEERASARNLRLSALKDEVNLLWDDVSTLKLCVPEYSRVRNRFISTFKRDKLNNATESDIYIIQEGNTMAHEGDAAVDALLYEGLNGRRDPSAFKELYGMHPADVVKIRHKETIHILSIHAGVRADSRKTGTDEFYRRFAEFVQLFEGSGCDESYLTAGSQCADVARAYWSILDCQMYQDSA
ncbi:hypothetical protein L873DRAFT_1818402 [Choiromyces venosus 120613-1]|uniref:SAP domain-containing protein n=1 Tax=Choiromyces venosus 120613-1 TaxID=1336337 RepID=A0A3N4J618_9PEZI|nr:hypothetical protein L873DRAFT_1818402 [Choiromyces venosus 120613-1]